MRTAICWFVIGLSLAAVPLAAQTSLTGGVTVGSAKLSDQRSERALSGVLQLQTTPWLSLSAAPSFVHVSDIVKGSAVSSNGVGDLPFSAAVMHSFPGPRAPTIAAALTIVLPTGNAACGLGNGVTSEGLDIGLGASPNARLHLSADASVPEGETPGLMMALDHGAVEASFATGQNSDILLTPDFRILIGGPGAAAPHGRAP